MSRSQTIALATCIFLYVIYLLYDWISTRRTKVIGLQFGGLILLFLFLRLYFGFPGHKTSFGPETSLLKNILLLICIMLGIISSYVFSRERFHFLECLRPLLISPIILLPLHTLIEKEHDIDLGRMLTLCLIAYQNGFFWKTIFKDSKNTLVRTTKGG